MLVLHTIHRQQKAGEGARGELYLAAKDVSRQSAVVDMSQRRAEVKRLSVRVVKSPHVVMERRNHPWPKTVNGLDAILLASAPRSAVARLLAGPLSHSPSQ